MIKEGKLRIEAEPNGVKAWLTIRLVKFACLAYHADWNFVENETDIPFLTSDNPVAVRYSGLPGAPVMKFMPITPTLGLMMTFDPKKEHEGILHKPHEEIERLLAEAPTGKIQSMHPYPATVRNLNKLVVQCAESLVFSSRHDEGIAKLVDKYGRYRIEQDFVGWRQSDGSFIHGVIMKVRESTN